MVLSQIEVILRRTGVPPTYQELSSHFGFASLNSIQRYLRQLETKGYIKMPPANQKRGLTLLASANSLQEAAHEIAQDQAAVSPEAVSLPLLGRVAAGAPIEALDHDEFLEVPASLVRNADKTYALRVQGQSMIEDGILDGDFILVQKQATAVNGEIVVAMVGDEATVKRFYRHGSSQIELRPANAQMQPMVYERGEISIRGIVVGLIRKFS
jgi:repressor LexA